MGMETDEYIFRSLMVDWAADYDPPQVCVNTYRTVVAARLNPPGPNREDRRKANKAQRNARKANRHA